MNMCTVYCVLCVRMYGCSTYTSMHTLCMHHNYTCTHNDKLSFILFSIGHFSLRYDACWLINKPVGIVKIEIKSVRKEKKKMDLIIANVETFEFKIERDLNEQYGSLPLPFSGMDSK